MGIGNNLSRETKIVVCEKKSYQKGNSIVKNT